MTKKCKICANIIIGRTDKLFCSLRCKNYYHVNLRKATEEALAVNEINAILKRNRSILLELLGKRKTQATLQRIELEKKKFHFKYHTHQHTNSKGKTYHYVYDFAWMAFSNDKVFVIRK